LTEDEAAHVQDLLRHSEKHVVEMDFDAIFSQSALAARLQYPPTVNVAECRALTKPKLKKKRKAAVLQTSEPHPTEITRLEAPILSSDKSSSRVNVREKSGFSKKKLLSQMRGQTHRLSLRNKRLFPKFKDEKFPNLLNSLVSKLL
jgi:hypothetical protein